MSNFLREYIMSRHGILYKIVSDNRIHFVNKQGATMLDEYGIKNRRSIPHCS